MVNLNGTQLPTVRRLLGYLTHWCANNASQEIISSIRRSLDEKKVFNFTVYLVSSFI